jgi:hypothetical protein
MTDDEQLAALNRKLDDLHRKVDGLAADHLRAKALVESWQKKVRLAVTVLKRVL